ncbi:High-affnity carbon uptake protein Hat/HatR [[Actinomadura] parvosata subsp. kistnae]|nr:High-affnity carbon uptake protein Hat/HatR [Actinomadura parvosata subsp. kistnae]
MADGGLLLAVPGARALLIGTGRHAPGSRLPDLPAVAATLADLRRCLVDRAGLDPAAVTSLIDPAGPAQVAEALFRAARDAEDVLLVHYAGHGVVAADGELYLATAATADVNDGPAEYQALPYKTITNALAACRAARVLLVLDCCYSGRAGAVSRAMDEVFDTSRHGLYILAAAGRDEQAWSPPGRRHTAFTGDLITLLDEGDPTAPAHLTLRDCRSSLARTLTAAGLPRPRHIAVDFDEHVRLCPNPAAKAGPASDDSFSPYRGLASFGPDDAGYFFGRADLIRTLVNRVAELAARPGPLIVTGASGAGKSSLLRAGLMPALATSRTRTKLLHPGADPVGELLRAFAAPGSRRSLEEDPAALRSLLPGDDAGGSPVIIVDQFEEVFTACRDETQRRTFIRALHASGAVVVIGVRADFFGHCARHAELHAALEHPVVVGPMTPDQLRQAIEGPRPPPGWSWSRAWSPCSCASSARRSPWSSRPASCRCSPTPCSPPGRTGTAAASPWPATTRPAASPARSPAPPTPPCPTSCCPARTWPAGCCPASSASARTPCTPAARSPKPSCCHRRTRRPTTPEPARSWTGSSTPASSPWTRTASSSPTKPSSAAGRSSRNGSRPTAPPCCCASSSPTTPASGTPTAATPPTSTRAPA